MTSFLNGVTASVINTDEVTLESDGPLIQCGSCPHKKMAMGRRRDMEGECQVSTKAENGITLLHMPRNAEDGPRATSRWEEAKKDCPTGFTGRMALSNVLISDS